MPRPTHFLQCLLISMLYYLPGVLLSRAYVSMSDPSATRCSLDDLVSRLTLEDFARLVSRWSHREGVSAVRVLHLLENGISTSEQVHMTSMLMPAQMSEAGQSIAADDFRHFQMMSKTRGPPSQQKVAAAAALPLNIGQLPSQQIMHHVPIGGHRLPPPSSSSGMTMHVPANFPLLPPPFGPAPEPNNQFRQAPGIRQQMSPVMPFETLRPPPDATVRIEDSVFGSSFSDVLVTVSPRMPITEALLQAAAKFDGENSPGGGFNRYKITWGQNSHSRCLVVRNVGSLGSNGESGGPVWEIIVEDRMGQELWRGVCIPSLAEVIVRPGMTITLNYAKQDDL